MKKKRIILIFLILLILPIVTGCWNERLLKDIRTVYLTGVDLDKQGNFVVTAVIRNLNISNSSRGETSISNEVLAGKGKNIKEASLNLDVSVAGDFDPVKGRTVILGNDIAMDDVYYIFDSLYREPRTNVNSKVVLSSESAEETIQSLNENEMEKAEYFYEMITSSEDLTQIPSVTVQTVVRHIFDEGRDFFLPYVEIDDEDQILKVQGTALFHDRSFTGNYLSIEESTLLLLFMEKKGRKTVLTNKLEQTEDEVVTYSISKVKRDLEVTKEEKVNMDISIALDVNINEYPQGILDNQEKLESLSKQLSKQLTKEAEGLFNKLAESKSDILGLGRELIAFHPSIWNEIKGENYYEQIKVNPKVEITILNQGLIL
ncbi:Ger(x)C family spore germination protein [Oceanobacillus sp. CAU 1775]